MLSNSTVGKDAPMQVIKQPEHGRTSAAEEKKLSSFQSMMSFENRIKSIILRNTLGLCKHSEIYLT